RAELATARLLRADSEIVRSGDHRSLYAVRRVEEARTFVDQWQIVVVDDALDQHRLALGRAEDHVGGDRLAVDASLTVADVIDVGVAVPMRAQHKPFPGDDQLVDRQLNGWRHIAFLDREVDRGLRRRLLASDEGGPAARDRESRRYGYGEDAATA